MTFCGLYLNTLIDPTKKELWCCAIFKQKTKNKHLAYNITIDDDYIAFCVFVARE